MIFFTEHQIAIFKTINLVAYYYRLYIFMLYKVHPSLNLVYTPNEKLNILAFKYFHYYSYKLSIFYLYFIKESLFDRSFLSPAFFKLVNPILRTFLTLIPVGTWKLCHGED